MKLFSTPEVFSALIFAGLLSISIATAEDVKPHSLYMKRLRERLSDYYITVPDSWDRSDSVQGKLAATSIETQSTSGRGEVVHLQY